MPDRALTRVLVAELIGTFALVFAGAGNIADGGATLPTGSQARSFLWELIMTAFLIATGPSHSVPPLESGSRSPLITVKVTSPVTFLAFEPALGVRNEVRK